MGSYRSRPGAWVQQNDVLRQPARYVGSADGIVALRRLDKGSPTPGRSSCGRPVFHVKRDGRTFVGLMLTVATDREERSRLLSVRVHW